MRRDDAPRDIIIVLFTGHAFFRRSASSRLGMERKSVEHEVTILQNGTISKFVDEVRSISFSAARALENRQRVLYITERCVFELTANGLALREVYPGVDVRKDILDLLPFDVPVLQA